jgi:hypothetical protein
MSTRSHAILTLLVLLALGLALFQCWYVYLPHEEAARFDLCRFSPAVDCFKSLNTFGESMRPFGIPAFPTLAALFFFQALLASFAWFATPATRNGWLTLARLLWFPAAGMAVYVLLHDLMVAKCTSASALLVTATALAGGGLTILQGLSGKVRGAGAVSAFLAASLLFGFFLFGAGSARLESAHAAREREAARPELSYPRFATAMPRTGAATAGADTAPCELLLFVDLADEAGLALARDAWARASAAGSGVRLVVYAPGALGAGLATARDVEAFLQSPESARVSDPALTDATEWKRRAGVEKLPAIVWDGGRRAGTFSIDEVFRTACGG